MAPCKPTYESSSTWNRTLVFLTYLQFPPFNLIYSWMSHGAESSKKPTQEYCGSSLAVLNLTVGKNIARQHFQETSLDDYAHDHDEQAVERSYEWLSSSLNAGKDSDIKFKNRCLEVIEQLQDLVQSKSDSFLKALVERIFQPDEVAARGKKTAKTNDGFKLNSKANIISDHEERTPGKKDAWIRTKVEKTIGFKSEQSMKETEKKFTSPPNVDISPGVGFIQNSVCFNKEKEKFTSTCNITLKPCKYYGNVPSKFISQLNVDISSCVRSEQDNTCFTNGGKKFVSACGITFDKPCYYPGGVPSRDAVEHALYDGDTDGSGSDRQSQSTPVTTCSKQNSSACPSSTTACSLSADKKKGNVGGGSDGDGNEWNRKDLDLLTGHYMETLVPHLSEKDNKDHSCDVGLSGQDNNGGRVTSYENDGDNNYTSTYYITNENPTAEEINVDGRQNENLSTSASSLRTEVLGNPHSPGQMFHAPEFLNQDVSMAKQSEQKILIPFNQEILHPGQDGKYIENRDFSSIRSVGSGAFGRCDLCCDYGTGNYIVRKKVKENRFEYNEISTWAKVIQSSGLNQNVLNLYGAFKDEEHVTMFMEYMSGTLDDIASMHPILSLSEKEVIAIVKPVLQCLADVHDNDIVHGDLKCGNLFFNESTFAIKLGDFGLSLHLQGELSLCYKNPRGTVYSMAYEVCRSEPYGRSADIWSLGCVIIHLLTGRIPWSEFESHLAVMYKIGFYGHSPEIPSCCSPSMKEMLKSMFCLDKTKRPTARELLQHPVFADPPDSPLDDILHNVFFRLLGYRYHERSLDMGAEALSLDTELMPGSCAPRCLSSLPEEDSSDALSLESSTARTNQIEYEEHREDAENLDFMEIDI